MGREEVQGIGAKMEFIFVRKNTSRDRDFSQQKSASLDLRALYYMLKSFFINFSLLSRLAHSHAVSVGARLASVDPFSTSFLLPNQVIVRFLGSLLTQYHFPSDGSSE